MNEEKREFKIEINELKGTCDSQLFRKMVANGDVTATKIQKMIGETVVITGYALCTITTDKKTFKMGYYATTSGIISTGSEVFAKSVKSYLDETKVFAIVEVSTRNGKTYKVSPILTGSDEKDSE